MNGIHDMGGMDGFGSVDVDDDAAFHEPWERRQFGVRKVLNLHGYFSHDELRRVREDVPPATYLGAGYYGQRLIAFERLLVEKDVLTEAEIASRLESVRDGEDVLFEHRDPALRKRMHRAIERSPSFEREAAEPRFEQDDRVVVKNRQPEGHTRCPRYVRRATGIVVGHHATQVFPDANAHGVERAEPLYSVQFSAAELWGDDHAKSDSVTLELWEPYLDRRDE